MTTRSKHSWLSWLPSMSWLILLSFVLVAAPLIYALLDAQSDLNLQTRKYQDLFLINQQISQRNDQLRAKLTEIERQSRKFHIVGGAALKDELTQSISLYLTTDFSIYEKIDNDSLNTDIKFLISTLTAIREVLNQNKYNSNEVSNALPLFHSLNKNLKSISSMASQYVTQQSAALATQTAFTKQQISHQIILFIVFVICFAMISLIFITRFYQTIFYGITQIGRGHLNKPIAFAGPNDIQQVGRQLDWLRQRLLDLEQEKVRFLRHISHELKSPLANIREGTTLLEDGVAGELTKQQLEIIRILDENGSKLQKLIENLLRYNEIGSTKPKYAETDLANLIHESVQAHSLNAAAREITINIDAKPIYSHCDAALMVTAMDNLITNAVAFSPDKGIIDVKLAQTEDGIEVSVADQGPGIPDDEKQNIFEPFVQGSAPRSGHLKSSGIGLSIAKECIIAHHGRVWVEDNQPVGSRFIILIPTLD